MKRKDFLRNTLPMAVIPSLLKPFSVRVLGDSPMLLEMLNGFVETDKVLVLVQLNGGNDGLNTLIPLDQYSAYFNARSNIAIPENNVLRLTGVTDMGFHPAMTGMQQLYNEGQLRIVQAVGYPNPNFSHFRATDIWMSGSSSNEVLTSGWAGRYLADQYPDFPTGYPNTNAPDPLGIQIGSTTSLALQGPTANMGISISSTSNFYNLINGTNDPVPPTPAGEALEYVRLVARQTNAYADRITDAASKVTQQGVYPTNNLADQLKIVARLIKGGLKTRVYMVSIGGFDTHAAQTNTNDPLTGSHTNLLSRVSSAIKAFQDDLKGLGVADRVIGMTFSEFGRRIRSNGSIGTDHGAAAPMFLFGTKVNPGITGVNPTIPTNALVNDNIPMQYDFRSVYASLLQGWFCAYAATLQNTLLQNFQQLSLCVSGNCGVTSVDRDTRVPGLTLIKNYPNPFSETTSIQFTTKGGHTLIQIIDTHGRVIQTLIDRDIIAGTHQTSWSAHATPAGLYYMRLQNGIIQQVKPIIKVK